MEDSQKRNSSVNVKEKDPLQDLEIGNDFFSWKSISMAEGDGLDFDLTPVSKGNKKTFDFDKALESCMSRSGLMNMLPSRDMDFNLDSDFVKISFNLDMPDLDISLPLKSNAKPKEKSEASSNGKDKGETDKFSFGFDFDEMEDFSFDPSTKKGTKSQIDKNNKGSSPSGSGCQDKEGSVKINQMGNKSTSKDGSLKPSLTETPKTFDMDCLVGVTDLEPTREICPLNSAKGETVTSEHPAATDHGTSDKDKCPLETNYRELPHISSSKRLVHPGEVNTEAGTKNDTMPDFSSDFISINERSGGDLSATEKNVESIDKNACSNVGPDGSMTLVVGSTSSHKHTLSRDSQLLQAVSENIDEQSGRGNSSMSENKVSCIDADVSGSNGEQDANMKLVSGSTIIDKHTSETTQHLQAVSISENICGSGAEDGTVDHVEDDRITELDQTNSYVENSCTSGAVSGMPCEESQEPSDEILKSSFIRGSQPADMSEKQTKSIKEPLINCSQPFIQSEEPECSVLKESAQTMFSSSSSKQIGIAQPSLVEGRAGDATQRDKKLFSLSLQCSKTLLRGTIPQVRHQESFNSKKIYGVSPIADRLQNGNKLVSGTAQVQDMVKTECALRQRGVCTNDLDTRRKAAENNGNPKKLASIPSNKNTPAQEHRSCSIESNRKPSDLPGLKLSRSSIDSTKSPIWRESKSVETSIQKSALLRKSPPGTSHLGEKCKKTISILSMKRALEDAAGDTIAIYPSKRLSQSVATSRSSVEKSEKFTDKKAPRHNRIEYELIKITTGNCQVTSFDIPDQVETRGVEILSSTGNDGNIKLADVCSKELDNLCDILRKKHDEAKELLVRAVVNSNRLLMLNNPLLEEKITNTQQHQWMKSSATAVNIHTEAIPGVSITNETPRSSTFSAF